MLEHGLDHPLPESIAVGGGTSVFVAGWAFETAGRIRHLELTVDGVAERVSARRMPRRDVARAHPGVGSARRSGFWGFASLRPGPERFEIGLRATLSDGSVCETPLGTIAARESGEALEAPPAPPDDAEGPLVAICMATHNPPPDLFRAQLASIRAQSHRNWVCVISDDRSSPETFESMLDEIGDDPRVAVSRASARLGFARNFERAMALAPRDAEFVALADQDDSWHPDKLTTLFGAIGSRDLAFSDCRLTEPSGAVRSETFWTERRPNHDRIVDLLVTNCVPGSASLVRRGLLDVALPLPPQFAHYHDHWLALVARARAGIAYVDRPLYDYVQHGSAVIGHAGSNGLPGFRRRLGGLRQAPREAARRARERYFTECCRLIQLTLVLDRRVGSQMRRSDRRRLKRFARADNSPAALVALAARGMRELTGDSRTLGADLRLLLAFMWRWCSASGWERLDAKPPAALRAASGSKDPRNALVRIAREMITPLELTVDDRAPERTNLLIPSFDLEHFFGGYIAKLNLARRLAERGERVRVVTTDASVALPRDWQDRISAFRGLGSLFEQVEFAFGREAGLEVSPADRFIATTWWTAYSARAAAEATGGAPFLYLIQECEPLTFPMGTYAALARDSYRFPHRALFSSELLREYFRRHRIGVFADGGDAGDARSLSFQNAITPVPRPSAADLDRSGPRRLLFYARPETHAQRNMFELGVLALAEAVNAGAFAGEWTFTGIGSVEGAGSIALGADATLELLRRDNQSSYAEILRRHDVGLALMLTPHPSLVPIEMASAGMVTVTNTFENKTGAALAAISPNIIAAEPGLDAIVGALAEAAAATGNHDRRASGSAVEWSTDWETSLSDELMLELDRVRAS